MSNMIMPLLQKIGCDKKKNQNYQYGVEQDSLNISYLYAPTGNKQALYQIVKTDPTKPYRLYYFLSQNIGEGTCIESQNLDYCIQQMHLHYRTKHKQYLLSMQGL